MDQAPLIGYSGRRSRLAALFPRDAVLLAVETAEIFFSSFADQITAAGGVPFPLPWDADPQALVARLDGLILTGGEDIDPAQSGATSAAVVDHDRDAVEFALLDAALGRGLPVLGVCRGMQLINVALGGTLGDAPAEHDRRDIPFRTVAHEVRTSPGTLVEELYGATVEVNSVHHQRIDRLADGLRPAACAPDGCLEAVWDPSKALLAVQWHPEFHSTPEPSFTWVVSAAAGRSATEVSVA